MKRKATAGSAVALLIALSALAWHHSHALAAQAGPAIAPEVRYVASRVRLPFHRPDCKWAAKISPKNLEVFETREQAIAAGHRPCKVCNP